MASHCDCNNCKLPARVAVVSSRYISLRCGPHAVIAARQLLAAGRTVRADALLPTMVSPFVSSTGDYYASDVDARTAQCEIDRRAVDYAARVDRAARAAHSQAVAAGASAA